MKTPPSSQSKPLSEAKLAANQANAQLSTGPSPASTLKTRFNARGHGLSAKAPELILNTPKKRAFFRQAWAQLGPCNAVEAGRVRALLFTRVKEEDFLAAEAMVLTRKPVRLGNIDERLYPFLEDAWALKSLDQLARHLADLANAADKEILALLQARKDKWGEDPEGAWRMFPVQALETALSQAEGGVSQAQPGDNAPAGPPGTLPYLLADTRLILAGEDGEDYTERAKALWATYRPTNTLEGFVVSDLIQTQWRQERVLGIQEVLFERSAVSATDEDCGIGLAFIQDSQYNQALASLDAYEAALGRRLHKRSSLLRKLRKEGWTENPLLNKPSATS